MAKRKANGEGTIFQRPNGTWAAQITVGRDPATGKLKRLTFSGKTRKEVQEKLTAALAQMQQGTFVEPSKVTVGEWLDTWLNEYKRPPKTRPTTWQMYDSRPYQASHRPHPPAAACAEPPAKAVQ